jgi:prepilin-type N-terminal cleavage/methylation domain-containing protein
MAQSKRKAFTLVEMLVAMTASLILFGAVLTIFQILGDAVSRSRRTGRLDSDMCSLRLQLQQDLDGITANRDARGLLCEVESSSITGYFEIIEGPNSDLIDYVDYSQTPFIRAQAFNRDSPASGPTTGSDDRIVGDTDDILFFTTRRGAQEPFIGKAGGATVSATQAEVAYFCRPTPGSKNPTLYTLYRRQLLITGGTATFQFQNQADPRNSWNTFYAAYDLSARREVVGGVSTIVLNNANDLQRRRNRFAHDPLCSGTARDLQPVIPYHPNNVLAFPSPGPRANEDVVATNLLAFDVRVLDPLAVERQRADTLRMQPGDQRYGEPGSVNVSTVTAVYGDLGFNSFVGLFHGGVAAPGIFSGYGRLDHVLLGSATSPRTYDTWTSFYRTNNENDDNDVLNRRDDVAERPPYAEQLAGIQITLRLYDVGTRTVKQATITRSFRK